jgi:hypothetical protein
VVTAAAVVDSRGWGWVRRDGGMVHDPVSHLEPAGPGPENSGKIHDEGFLGAMVKKFLKLWITS